MISQDTYSKLDEARNVFFKGILENPLISKDLPAEAASCAARIHFSGSKEPMIPINWRLSESISALKAFEATLLNVLLLRKYGVEPPCVAINTNSDHASLLIMSALLYDIDPNDKHITLASNATPEGRKDFYECFPSWDKGDAHEKLHRIAATNIYKTKDGRFYHLHGSMNPDPTIQSLSLPLQRDTATYDDALKPYIQAVSTKTAEDMDKLENDDYRQAGTICMTSDEYFESEHGKANASVGLFEIEAYPNAAQAPCWWLETPHTSAKRPLAGLKVVDLTRVIAGPAVSKGLAELGASVMRVTCPRLPDYTALHLDLNWGKWNSSLDFKLDEEREKMRNLILEADVIVQGYRPGVLDKFGFGHDEIIQLCESRSRGIIVVRENCYGWHGPWAGRSGWQQISDACCGVSTGYGRAMGHDEAVTPVFPNSDYCTGVIGVAGVLQSLLKRASDGGSYRVDISLNYYSQWLVRSCGTYPSKVWQELWKRNGQPVFRHYQNMTQTIPAVLKLLMQRHGSSLFRPGFFEERPCPSIGYNIKVLKPALQYPDGEVEFGFNVGTRTNGVDKPYWPEDLASEFVR
ncbi:uncharacterized protein E0L32_007897 [Thyridium curvatum]|uniref:Uncharacterized protein n=1 Tax=Thyridium curvatum TaxID=1093900 RepID=A0A507B3K0_9PEZI|nr:uncharacterized protein E0L32_007897 [Thyridium curvatum]TPX11478.1 hypothetical protein E0L32_007897 [Thyridium curvatum]